MRDSTTRFSSRVDDYIKYRPHYPGEIVGVLKRECGLTSESAVADIGSGTGMLTELFLENGNPVVGVEPNKEMREAGERLLGRHARFQSVAGTAEATTLPARSVDFVTAGQAFHWFDRSKTRAEFVRILKPGGWVVLIWNDRNTARRPFFREYEELLVKFGTDYEAVKHSHIEAQAIGSFFTPMGFQRASCPNGQVFDFEGLKGRLMSSSYAPEPGHPNHAPMLEHLRQLFDRHQANGKVEFEYETSVYYGRLTD